MANEKGTTLLALTAAAMMLQGVGKKAEANPLDQKVTLDYRFSNYEEALIPADKLAEGSAARYTIDVNQLKFKAPISEDTELIVSALQESMSGASPWYIVPDAEGNPIQVMSGATIAEDRNEVGLDFRSYNKNSETTLSAGYSGENDYKSFSFGFSGALRFNQNLTSLSYGLNTAKDYIDATDADIYLTRPTEQIKNRIGLALGISHVASKSTLLGISFGYINLDGFLSDTYKLALVENTPVQESRPGSHEQLTASLMLREYFDSVNAALHVDYRYYSSNWNMDSHTVELAWYQNLGKGWQLIPSLRAYEQTQAEFYRPYYINTRADGYYSSDYRLSDFSALSGQLKLAKAFEAFTISVTYETYESEGDNPALISYDLYSLGMGYKF